MKKLYTLSHRAVFIMAVIYLMMSCNRSNNTGNEAAQSQDNMLPKVLFITSGLYNDKNVLPKGITIAIQSFNKQGAIVELSSREILYNPDKLASYNILILSTSPQYHDADRIYSLSFMSNVEMTNISNYVKQGGVLIAGDNVGRNQKDGTDRVSIYQKLTKENNPLAACFGVDMIEKNMSGYGIYGYFNKNLNSIFKPPVDHDLWTLVPDSITGENTNVLGFWYTNSDTIPAIIQNRFGRGTSYLFPGSDFLHPAGEGGVWSADKISIFYTFVLSDFHQKNNIPVSLNPWPDGHDYAFCMTFNAEGTLAQYQQLTNYLENRNIEPMFFVSGRVPDDIRTFINDGDFNTGSTGFRYQNYRNTMFPDAVDDIIANEVSWEKKFKGFRFPYTQAGYWGLLALEENNYEYVSSIGVNNIEFFHGAAFPYNLVIAKNQYYKTTDLLEVGPIYHDDYFFLNESCNEDEDNPQLAKDIDLYNKYLSNFWERAIKPYNGLMVYLGHPAYVGFNDQTLAILDSLILRVSNDDTWMTNICDVVSFRKDLASMRFYVKTDDKKIVVTISAPQEIKLNGVTLNINNTTDFKKVSAASGKAVIKNEKLYQQVVFDAFDGQEIIISR